MAVIWLNGTIGSGKTAVGRALAEMLRRAVFMDGDDHAGGEHLPVKHRWDIATATLIRAVTKCGISKTLVVAYPLQASGYIRLRTACARAHRALLVVNLAPPLSMTLRSRGGRTLDAGERARIRVMRSEGYHRRRFADVTLANAVPPARRTAVAVIKYCHARGHALGERLVRTGK